MDLEHIDKEKHLQTPIWGVYTRIIEEAEGRNIHVGTIGRFDFYERAKESYAVVATGEKALYGNIILKKGVIPWT